MEFGNVLGTDVPDPKQRNAVVSVGDNVSESHYFRPGDRWMISPCLFRNPPCRFAQDHQQPLDGSLPQPIITKGILIDSGESFHDPPRRQFDVVEGVISLRPH